MQYSSLFSITFLMVGVKTLIVCLLEALDRETVELMTAFYSPFCFFNNTRFSVFV